LRPKVPLERAFPIRKAPSSLGKGIGFFKSYFRYEHRRGKPANMFITYTAPQVNGEPHISYNELSAYASLSRYGLHIKNVESIRNTTTTAASVLFVLPPFPLSPVCTPDAGILFVPGWATGYRRCELSPCQNEIYGHDNQSAGTQRPLAHASRLCTFSAIVTDRGGELVSAAQIPSVSSSLFFA
jgi:hypothetical protein